MRVAPVLVAAALLAVPAALAKPFEPGDLRICGREQCAAIQDRNALEVLSTLYWGPGHPRRAQPVRAGAPAFKLRFRSGYVSGIVAGRGLDRFRPYGFYCGRFHQGTWYRIPTRAIVVIRRLAGGLQPSAVPRVPSSFC